MDPSKYVDIPYMESISGTPDTKRIYGTTQRDLTTGTPAGAYLSVG